MDPHSPPKKKKKKPARCIWPMKLMAGEGRKLVWQWVSIRGWTNQDKKQGYKNQRSVILTRTIAKGKSWDDVDFNSENKKTLNQYQSDS